MKGHPLLTARIFDTPLLIQPEKLQTILQVLAADPTPQAREVDRREQRQAGYMASRGVAIMPMHGTLVARGDWIDAMSGLQSYSTLRQSLQTYLDDDSVGKMLLDVSCFGGEVELCAETAGLIRAASQQKPITALAHDYAFSAAYWLASAASEFVATPAAEVGSIGVVMTHQSVEKAAAEVGIATTHIFAGAHKVDLSPWFDLSESTRAAMQARIDELYIGFVNAVGEYRGIDPAVARGTEARLLSGAEAAKLGLIDRVDSFDNVLSTLQASKSSAATRSTVSMSENAITTVAQLRDQYPSLCNDIEAAARADVDEKITRAEAAAFDRGTEEGAKAERERIAGIHEIAAEGHEALVSEAIADGTSTAADVALKIVKADRDRGTSLDAQRQDATGAPAAAPPSGDRDRAKVVGAIGAGIKQNIG